MTRDTIIPEEEWIKVQSLVTNITRRTTALEEETRNLNNLLHALHGEGVRSGEYTRDRKPAIFKDGHWISR